MVVVMQLEQQRSRELLSRADHAHDRAAEAQRQLLDDVTAR
jgi:hypothetical protein